MPAPDTTSPAEPLQAIAGFAALLRAHGLQVGVAEQQFAVLVRQTHEAKEHPDGHAVRKIAAERQQLTDLNQQLHVLEQTLKG